MSIPYHTSNLAKLPILRSNTETVNSPSGNHHDLPAAIAIGVLSASAYVFLCWFQIG